MQLLQIYRRRKFDPQFLPQRKKPCFRVKPIQMIPWQPLFRANHPLPGALHKMWICNAITNKALQKGKDGTELPHPARRARTNSWESRDDAPPSVTHHVQHETSPTNIEPRHVNERLYGRPGNCRSVLEKPLEFLRAAVSLCDIANLRETFEIFCWCPGFGWDRVNFPPGSCCVSDLVPEECW